MLQIDNKYITNNSYPTLYVKNFAKIEEAEVEFAPFTLFVGDNNSGKSYVMNLVWGLLHEIANQNISKLLSEKNIEALKDTKAYQNIKSFIKATYQSYISENNEININIDKEIIYNHIELLNNILDNNKEEFISSIFDNFEKSISIEELKISIPPSLLEYKFQFKIKDEEVLRKEREITKDGNMEIIEKNSTYAVLLIEYKRSGYYGLRMGKQDIDKSITVLIHIMLDFISNIFIQSNSLFLPSSRTGFTLLRSDIKKQAMDNLLDSNVDENKFHHRKQSDQMFNLDLTKPTKEFVRMFFGLRHTKNNAQNNEKILKLIEQEIIHGEIFLEDEETNDNIKYKPSNCKYYYPPKNTSAVVTELTPLILFLKYKENWKNLLMEEPEISLHPQLQQQIARILIKLVNSDKQVFITTHSDTIIQHINNMIKLYHNKPDRQKKLLEQFSYDNDDILNPDNIRMYQFDVENDKTIVGQLSTSKYGFKVPTFNKFLSKASDEIEELLEEL